MVEVFIPVCQNEKEICVQKVNELSRNQMIWTDEDGFLLKPLDPGRLMTKYYLRFDTMKNIMQAPADCSMEEALHIICRSEEISWIQLRRNEKKLLNDINTDKEGRLRFRIFGDKGKRKRRIQTREEKIFVLANDCLTGDPLLHDLSMSQDMNAICSNGCRIAKCMKEFFIYRKNYKEALNSTLLAKSLYQKLWDDCPYLLKQLPGIGMVTAKALHSMGVNSFETLSEADPRKIEIVTGRKFPFGNHIKESLLSLPPKVEMNLEETEGRRQGKSNLVVTLTRLLESAKSTKRHFADMIVALEEDNLILFHEKIRVDEFSSPYSATILVPNPRQEKLNVKADLIFEEFIGVDLHQKHIVQKEVDLNVTHKHGSQRLSSFPQLKDVCVIEDDNNNTSYVPTKGFSNSNKSKGETGCIPSFNLLDEELEEGEAIMETEDSDCKITTERTVFDHIREKAKSFPAFAASSNACSPSSEALLLIRKRAREKQIGLENVIEILEETKGNNIPSPSVLSSSSEHARREQKGRDVDKTSTTNPSVCHDTIYLADDRGTLPPESEESTSKTLTEETIFEHIRKKAKNFPMVNNLKSLKSESFIPTRKIFSRNQLDPGTAGFDMLELNVSNYVINTEIISDSEPMEMKNDIYQKECSHDKHNLLSQSSCDQTSFKLPAFRYQMVNNEFSHKSPGSSSKQPHSSSVSRRQCCSVREVDSFLGFKSVFSFL